MVATLATVLLVAFYTPYPNAWMKWAVPIAIVIAVLLLAAPQFMHA
jgi:hypothetical protein